MLYVPFCGYLFRGEIHEPDVGVRCDVCEINCAVVAGEGGAADVNVLIRDLEYLMILSRRRVIEIDGSLAHKQQMTIIVEPKRPIPEVR